MKAILNRARKVSSMFLSRGAVVEAEIVRVVGVVGVVVRRGHLVQLLGEDAGDEQLDPMDMALGDHWLGAPTSRGFRSQGFCLEFAAASFKANRACWFCSAYSSTFF